MFKWEVVISNTSKETKTKLDTTGVIVYRGSHTGKMQQFRLIYFYFLFNRETLSSSYVITKIKGPGNLFLRNYSCGSHSVINKNKENVVGNGFSWMSLIGPVSKDNQYLLSFLSVGLNDAYAFIKPCLRLFLLPDWFGVLYECQMLD